MARNEKNKSPMSHQETSFRQGNQSHNWKLDKVPSDKDNVPPKSDNDDTGSDNVSTKSYRVYVGVDDVSYKSDGVSTGAEKNSTMTFAHISRKSKFVLVFCIIAKFFSGCSFAVMAPFFPQEAEKKGMSTSAIGFIFSIFELIIFLSSPVFGNYMITLGPKFMYLSGIFVGGLCNMMFGALHWCPAGTPFIVLSFAIRSVQSLGFRGFVTASFAIVSSEFPTHATTCFGLTESAFGTGLMVGPAIGGFLYEVGGFGLPFYAIGSSVVLCGFAVWNFLPAPNGIPSRRQYSVLILLKSLPVILSLMSVCFCAMGATFLEPTLANHLAPFGLATGIVSLFFVITPLMNATFSPLWGYLADKKNIQYQLRVFGHLVFGIGFLVAGPSPLFFFLPFKIATVVIGLMLVGITFGCILVNSMRCTVLGCLEMGFEDNVETYGAVGGIYSSVYTLGGFIGPSLGGILSEKYGSFLGFTVIGMSNILMGVVVLTFYVYRCWNNDSTKEGERILKKNKTRPNNRTR